MKQGSSKFMVALSFLLTAMLLQLGMPSLHAAEGDPVVSITSGKIAGRVLPSGRAEFLGIPYAQPPVGDLRWHEPVPPKPWDGVRDAKVFGSPCAQNIAGDWNRHDAEISKEDCLYLNVITPHWPLTKPLPVMFWIHGGANTGGTASAHLYKDGTLVDHGIILVTANYRLDIFGFFAHPELTQESSHHASGNYAILDQIAALKWVRDNIAKFGGDPNNVTVFGQSAGAYDAGLLMTSPLAKGLFQRAIEESGSVTFATEAPTLTRADQVGSDFAANLKAPQQGQLKYLRSMSAKDLLAAVQNAQRTPNAFHADINVDAYVFPSSPAAVFAQGKEAAIPLIVGNNSTEFDFPASADELRQRIGEIYKLLAPRALQAYGLSNGGQGTTDPVYGTVANQWSADLIFRCPATAVAAWHNAAHHPTYEYQLEHAIPGQEKQGAVHSADLPYVFGFYPETGNISGPFGPTDYKIADNIEKYWTNFARTGNPNGDGVADWPEFDGTQSYIAITEAGNVVPQTKLRDAQCSIFRQAINFRLARGSNSQQQ